MIPFEAALALVLAAFRPLPAEIVSLDGALGRVLAEDVIARVSHPPFDASAMDGYAVRSADVPAGRLPVTLPVVGQAVAGAGFGGPLAAGQAVRILTGAPLPAGADAVVIQEHTEKLDGAVRIGRAATPGRWIRRAGQDFAAGEMLLRAGRRLTSRDIGLAAAMNVPWLAVRRRPRIAVLATGDELARPGETPGAAGLIESGGAACGALMRACGAEVLALGIARDDPAELAHRLRAAAGCDLLLTIGGVSVGDLDLMAPALADVGFTAAFHRVAMRPGKPLLFGRMGDTPVLGLPGNPVSAWVTALLFARPAVGTLLGLDPPAPPAEVARAGAAIAGNDERRDHLRAALSRDGPGALTATVLSGQDSAMIRPLAAADCLVVRPPHAPPVAAGGAIEILRLGDAGGLA